MIFLIGLVFFFVVFVFDVFGVVVLYVVKVVELEIEVGIIIYMERVI